MANKTRIQALIFDKKHYPSRHLVKGWISKNNYIIDQRLKHPIMKSGNTFRVRQRNPDWFRKPFKVESLGKGVKGVYGVLKNNK